MSPAKKLVGLLGGTFDPIHLGHLDIARKLLVKNNFSELQFLPNHNPPHKHPIANIEDRLAMIRLAIADEPKFSVNDIEVRRPGLSYTIDTLEQLTVEASDTIFCFILASDAFINFNQWKNWQEILNYCHLIIVPRPIAPLPDEPWLTDLLKTHEIENPMKLMEKNSGYIIIEDVSPSRINATKIRQDVSKGFYPEDMLTKSVIRYIKEHGLYQQ